MRKADVSESSAASPNASGTLCSACGLCCNGVLFVDVQLQRGDQAQRLRELGLSLHRKGGKTRLAQPCACFDGKLCRIYEDRPARCRSFACRLLKRVQEKEVRVPVALRRIDRARREAERVRQLVRALGNRDEHLPLSRRYAAIMTQPLDLAGADEVLERRAELMMAVHALTTILETDFL